MATDDFITNEVRQFKNQLVVTANLYAKITAPVLSNLALTDFEKSVAFKASLDLVLEGNISPSGYTEPILHKRRLELKSMLG